MLFTLLDDAPSNVANLLYLASGSLVAAIIYMYLSHKKEIKEKDNAILKVNEEHRNDIKESNKDYKYLVDKFSEYMNQIEKIINAKK